MYPDQNQYSIDYLNQIAPVTKKPGLSNRFAIIFIVVGVIIAAIIGLSLLTSAGNGPTADMSMLASRLAGLQTITNKAQSNIRSSSLRTTNSGLSLFLTNTNRDIVAPLAANHIVIAKISKEVIAAGVNVPLTAKLEDARLNAIFDETYARQMDYELGIISGLMTKIYKNTKSKSLKDFLLTTDQSLQPIHKQFSHFTTQTQVESTN